MPLLSAGPLNGRGEATYPVQPYRSSSALADLALLAVAAIWGLTFTAVKRALDDTPPMSFLAARFTLAAALLALACPHRAYRITWRGLAAAALLGLWLTAGYALQTAGLIHTTASKSAFITGLSVVLVPLLSLALSRRLPRPGSLVAVLLATGGLYLLTSPRAMGFNIGDSLTLGCAAAFALHIITTERAAPRHDPVPLAFWQIVTTAILCAALMGFLETPALSLTPWTVFALAITGVFATALAFGVQMWAQRRTSATHVAVIFSAEPVFAALFARLVQHESLGLTGLLGAALILLGILLAQVGPRLRISPSPPS
jgi:drug/metabolite transporter (DMT)-like permease